MNQNLLSRLFRAGSIYETFNEDAESSAGYNPDLSQSSDSQLRFGMSFHPYNAVGKSRANMGAELDDGVPESLLYEDAHVTDDEDTTYNGALDRPDTARIADLPPRPVELNPHSTWHQTDGQSNGLVQPTINTDRDRELWKFANVHNLDIFLRDVYEYHRGNGIYSILLDRALGLLTLAFVISFTTYLWYCIDYGKIRSSTSLPQIQVDHCMARLGNTELTVLWLLSMAWFVKLFQSLSDARHLWDMHKFYKHLLDISETDMQTISWQEISNKLVALRESNPLTSRSNPHSTQTRQRMDAHDIANRIMRKENYLVAMYNKEVLDLTVPMPFLANFHLLTRTLEWNLSLCLLAYIFDERGQVRPAFVRESGPQRQILVSCLKRRFRFAALMNVLCAPFIIIYLLLLYFFKYFSEYHKNPSSIGSRDYTPYAQWKFREFNELRHIFERRINLSHKLANKYIAQFPNDKTMQLARFVSFVAGSITAVLALASVIDPELFLGFEISPDRTVLFYLGLFGTIVAVSRSMVPEETQIFDPEAGLTEVIELTHFSPAEWSGKFHSHETKVEFCKLYDYKLSIFLQEILSTIVTPLILLISLPNCSEKIIDFVKDFTVHVDGIGHVCSFALFDFSKNGNVKFGAPSPTAADNNDASLHKEFASNDGKMEKSFLNFKASNPDWIPDQSGTQYLQSLRRKVMSDSHHIKAASASRTDQAPSSSHTVTSSMQRSPARGSRKPAPLARDSYAIQSLRARRGLDASVNMTSTIYSPYHNPARPARIQEEEPQPSNLGESFYDTTKQSSPIKSPATDEQQIGAGVLGLLNQFYQEAGTRAVRV